MNAKPGIFENLRRVGDNLYKCDGCRRTMRKQDSLIMYNRLKRRSLRLCRKCQLVYYMNELKDLNPKLDVKLEMQAFSKNIKDGIDNR
jgi:hypothetical protein